MSEHEMIHRGFKPSTFDETERSVEMVIATEEPVVEWDRRSGKFIPTIIRVSGIEFPDQVPMLDTHSREGVSDVLGSIRSIRVEGDKLIGKAIYGRTAKAEDAMILARDGHLTDYSIGCIPLEAMYEDEGKPTVRKIITRSRMMEVSNCPIGADASAKLRAAVVETTQPPAQQEPPSKERAMSEDKAPNTVDADAVKRAAIDEQKEIAALCRDHKLDPVEMIGRSLSEVKEVALKRHAEALKAEKVPSPVITRGEDQADKTLRAMELGLTLRSGLQVADADASVARSAAGLAIHEMAREVLRSRNLDSSGSRTEVIKRAASTSDFPLITANLANKMLKEGWGKAETHWQKMAQVKSVSDFKPITLSRALGATNGFKQVEEGGEYPIDKRSEEQEQAKVAKYGNMFDFTYELMVNDDLGALQDSMAQFGEQAAQLIEDLFFGVLTANAAMGDGTALFHANHGNLITGAPSEASVQAMLTAMTKQKEGVRYLNIRPKFLVAPIEQRVTWEKLLNSGNFNDSNAASTQINTASGFFAPANRIYVPYFGATVLPWYALAERNTISMLFLDGKQTPTLDQKVGFEVDGIRFKARLEVGAKATDWRGVLKSSGA